MTWSLQIELIAIPVILIVYLGWQRWGPIAVAVALAILLALAFSVRWNALIPGQYNFGQIDAFVFGMAAFLFARRLMAPWSPARSAAILAVSAGVFLISRDFLGQFSQWSSLFEAASAAMMIAVLAFGRAGAAAALLDLRLTRILRPDFL